MTLSRRLAWCWIVGVAPLLGGYSEIDVERALSGAPEFVTSDPALDDDRWEPPAVYLTWQGDMTTTMTVHWHSWPDRPRSVVRYRPADAPGSHPAPGNEPGGGLGPAHAAHKAWSVATGTSRPVPGTERIVHTVELTGLRPDTTYVFRPGPNANDFRFATLPDGPTRPIRFIASGCAYKVEEVFVRLADRLAERDPDFAILAGDIAYANASLDNAYMWLDFLRHWKDRMVTSDGRLVPMLWTIGNHEVSGGGYGQPKEAAPFFYDLIAFPQHGYGVVDAGDYLSLVLLDSNHTTPIAGEQTDWLAATLAEREGVTHLMPAYHVPAYPSARRFDGAVNARVRKHWVPLFEEHGVDVVFEAHDHAYKRTHPILGGEVDEDGVVYIGDGGWSTAGTRTPAAPGDRWYLAATAAANHAVFVTLDGDLRTFEAIDVHGNLLEEPYRMTAGLASAIILTGGAGPGLPWWLWLVIAGGVVVAVVVAVAIVRRKAQQLLKEFTS